MRNQILTEIRRLAEKDGGQPPGARLFEKHTGIRQSAWRGVYWARWGDAVTEAGLSPNVAIAKYEEKFLLGKVADLCRELGKIPTAMEFRIYNREHSDFPNHKSIYRHFQSTENLFRRLAEWTSANEQYADVAPMLASRIEKPASEKKSSADGFVYLIQWGANYKIGRGDQLEKRVKQVLTGLPDSGSLVHAIRTDDPPGIEAYWHRRFADRRAPNGEWFKLTKGDVSVFKRRTFQ